MKTLVGEFQRKRAVYSFIIELSAKLFDACRKIERSWSGSYAGWHGRLYFRNFEIPSITEKFSGEWGAVQGIPEGWQERESEEVKAEIEELVGNSLSLDEFEQTINRAHDEANNTRDEITILLSNSQFDQSLAKEKSLFDQIEKFEFGITQREYIEQNMPKTLMTRDKEAIRQGICLPAWLYYEALAYEGKSILKASEEFIKIVERFIRQMKMKSKSDNNAKPGSVTLQTTIHPEIFTKCNSLYAKGVYPEAVEKSFKVVRDRLRSLTGHETGSEAFGKGRLHIKGAAAPHVDEDFNKAVKFLTMAIDNFRNEKSHTSDAKMDNPIRAYEYLNLSSLAMNLLDNSEIISDKSKLD